MIGSIILLAATLSAGNAEFDRTAAEGAARISLNRYSAELVKSGVPTGELAQAMLADSSRYSRRGEAETACRELYRKAIDRLVAEEAASVRARLGLEPGFVLTMKAGDREALESRFGALFDAEREAAVTEQAKGIAATTRPTEEDLERKDEVELRREMTERVLAEQKTAVFEENRRYITEELVAPIIASGWEERNRQAEYLKRARCEGTVPSKLKAELEAKLVAHVADRMKGVVPTKSWGVFPSIRNRGIPEQVEKRLTDRFVRQIDEVSLEITAADVEAVIARDPAAHVKASDSQRIFAGLYERRILEAAQAKALGDLRGPDRSELEAFLKQRLDSEDCRKAVERVIRREVRPKWSAARAEVARRLADDIWPTLVNGTWFPGAELADAIAARSDYGQAVRGWRTLAEMERLASAPGGRPMLEESVATADRRVGEAFERARNAIAAQNAIVDEVHPEVLAEARRQASDLRTVEKLLLSATVARWDERRQKVLWPDGKLPPNAAEQHLDIFPSVLKKIELVARQILEEAQEPQPKQEEAKPEEPKPEEPPPEEPPPEEPPPDQTPEEELPEEELFSLSVKRTSEGIEVKLLQGKKVVEESVVPAKAKDFRKAMEQLTKTLSTRVLDLK